MPEFKPTEWMLDNQHKDKTNNWEIYAECLREAMARQGGFNLEDRPNRQRLAYEDFMEGKTKELTIDGQTFTWAKNDSDDDFKSAKEDIENKPNAEN